MSEFYPKLKLVKLALECLSVYRNLIDDKVVGKLYALIEYLWSNNINLGSFVKLYNEFYFELASNNPELSLKNYIIQFILYEENPFSLRTESLELQKVEKSLVKAVSNDLNGLQLISDTSSTLIKQSAGMLFDISELESGIIEKLPEWGTDNVSSVYTGAQDFVIHLSSCKNWGECVQHLSEYHKNNGSGIFARYKAFIWRRAGDNHGFIEGIAAPDPVTFSDLIGYDEEQSEVIENTLRFLKGYPSNNMLLYGDRGTGKSSTVKALLNKYHMRGLRIVEVPKACLPDFPDIIKQLRDRNLKFIVFIDDLAFDDSKNSYTSLKAVLEGGMEVKPENMLIYATSNRRHLIKERFSDRNDEVHSGDAMQEKLSLADRFGITVIFASPDKKKYLEIVEGIVQKRGLKIDRKLLHEEALKWELQHSGPSPRTARQFVDWLVGSVTEDIKE